MLYNNKKVSTLVENQLPEHIRDNYTLFTKFLIYYYEYMEQTGQPVDMSFNYLKNVGLADSTGEYFEKVAQKFVADIPLSNIEDKKTLIQNMVQFYNSKGTEESFAFILNTLFGETVGEGYIDNDRFMRWDDGEDEPKGAYTLNGTMVEESTVTPYDGHSVVSISSDGVSNGDLFMSFLSKDGETGFKTDITYDRHVVITTKVYIKTGDWVGMGMKLSYRNPDDSINTNKTISFTTNGTADFTHDLSSFGTGVWVDVEHYLDMGYDNVLNDVSKLTMTVYSAHSEFGTIGAKELLVARMDVRSATAREILLGQAIDHNLPTVTSYYPKNDIHVLSTNNVLSGGKYLYDGEYYQNHSYVLVVSNPLYDAIIENKANVLEMLHPIGKKIYLKNIDTDTLVAL